MRIELERANFQLPQLVRNLTDLGVCAPVAEGFAQLAANHHANIPMITNDSETARLVAMAFKKGVTVEPEEVVTEEDIAYSLKAKQEFDANLASEKPFSFKGVNNAGDEVELLIDPATFKQNE